MWNLNSLDSAFWPKGQLQTLLIGGLDKDEEEEGSRVEIWQGTGRKERRARFPE